MKLTKDDAVRLNILMSRYLTPNDKLEEKQKDELLEVAVKCPEYFLHSLKMMIAWRKGYGFKIIEGVEQ